MRTSTPVFAATQSAEIILSSRIRYGVMIQSLRQADWMRLWKIVAPTSSWSSGLSANGCK